MRSVTVEVFTVEAVIGSEKVTSTFASRATPVAFAAGVTDDTVGAVTSVKVAVRFIGVVAATTSWVRVPPSDQLANW